MIGTKSKISIFDQTLKHLSEHLENIPGAIILIDFSHHKSGRIVTANRPFQQLTGLKTDDLINQTLVQAERRYGSKPGLGTLFKLLKKSGKAKEETTRSEQLEIKTKGKSRTVQLNVRLKNLLSIAVLADLTGLDESSQELKDDLDHIESLNAFIFSANLSHDLSEFYGLLLRTILEFLGHSCGMICRLEDNNEYAELCHSQELSSSAVKKYARIKLTNTFRRKFIQKGSSLVTTNDTTAPWFPARYKHIFSIPVYYNTRVWALIQIPLKTADHQISREQRHFIDLILSASDSVVARIMTEEKLVREKKYLETSMEVTEILQSSGDLDRATEVIREKLDLHGINLGLLDRETNKLHINSSSTLLPKFINDIIAKVIINLNKNKTAADFFNTLDKPSIITQDLLLDFINKGRSSNLPGMLLNKLLSHLDKTIMGDMLLLPLINSQRQKTGAILATKQAGEVFLENEIILLSNLTHSVSMLLSKKSRDRQIMNMAYYDNLTGLPSMKKLKDILSSLIEQGKDFSLLTVKLLNFNRVIASMGDEIGDEFLKLILDIVTNILIFNEKDVVVSRPSGTAGFYLIMPHRDQKKLERFTERLIALCSMPYSVSGYNLYIDLNVGICQSKKGYTPDDLIKNCSLALQEVRKSRGSKKYKIYSFELRRGMIERDKLLRDMKVAIAQKTFTPHYQPKVSMQGEITGFEALARWEKDSHIIYPGVFIPILEDTGLSGNLFYIILEKVIEDIQHFKPHAPEISINLSPRQLNNPDLLSTIRQITEAGKNKMNGTKLKFELIETDLMDETNISAIKDIKALGHSIAIDDFGSGYANFRRLISLFKEEIIDELKIDSSLIRGIHSFEDATFITSIIDMAIKLNIHVVAEGVETVQQYLILKGINPRIIIQGWLFSKAMPIEEIRKLPKGIFQKKLAALIQEKN